MLFNKDWVSAADEGSNCSDRVGYRPQQLEACCSLCLHKHVDRICVINLKFHTAGWLFSFHEFTLWLKSNKWWGILPAPSNKAQGVSTVNQRLTLLLCSLSFQMPCSPASSGQRKIRTLESSGRWKERRWHLCTLITNLLVSDDIFTAFLCLLRAEKAVVAFLSIFSSLLPLLLFLFFWSFSEALSFLSPFHLLSL